MPDEITKPTKEQLREGMNVFFGEHGSKGIGLEEAPTKVEPKPGEKKEGEVVEGEAPPKKEGDDTQPPAPPAAAVPVAPAKPKRIAKKTETPPPVAGVGEDVIERVASETAARTAAAIREQTPPAPKPGDVQLEGLNLDAKDKKTIAKMQAAGRVEPKFADLAEKTINFWTAEKKYIEAWQKEHPGEPFKQDDHAEFYTKNEPQFEQDEFDDAVTKSREEEIRRQAREDARAEVTAATSKIDFTQRWRDEAPAINKVADESVSELITEIDPELAKLLKQDNEALPLPDALTKIVEKDKIVGTVLKRESGLLARMVCEVERLDRYAPSGHYQPDDKNPLHVMIFKAAREFEETIASLPKADQIYNAEAGDNRTFVRQSEWNDAIGKIVKSETMTEATKKQAIKDFEAKHWTLDANDVKSAVKGMVYRRVKEKIAEYREVAGNPAAAPATAVPPVVTQPPTPAPAPARPKPPSTSGGAGDKTSTTLPPNGGGTITQKQTDEVFFR